jgi:hypothetical protein
MIVVSKAEFMVPVLQGKQHECFEHSESGIFDITAMRLVLPNIGVLHTISLDQIVPFIMENRVTDPARVMQLAAASWRDDPGIFIVSDYDSEGTPNVTMVDGHHRAMRRAIEKETDMEMWFVPTEKAIRPAAGWMKNPYVDWGDPIVDGKIIRR